MKDNGKNDILFNGNGVSMYAGSLDEEKKKLAAEMHNKMVDEYTEALNSKYNDELEKAREITEKMKEMEIMPINGYVLVKPYESIPYQKVEVSKSGIIIPKYDGTFINPDTGEEDKEEQLSRVGTVIEVSPYCKFVKEGDDVYYRKVSGVPIPFFRQGLEVVAETSIQVVINSGLKERFKNAGLYDGRQ